MPRGFRGYSFDDVLAVVFFALIVLWAVFSVAAGIIDRAEDRARNEAVAACLDSREADTTIAELALTLAEECRDHERTACACWQAETEVRR